MSCRMILKIMEIFLSYFNKPWVNPTDIMEAALGNNLTSRSLHVKENLILGCLKVNFLGTMVGEASSGDCEKA